MSTEQGKAKDVFRSALFLFIFWMILTFPANLRSDIFWANLAQHIIVGLGLSYLVARITKGMLLSEKEASLFHFKYAIRLFIYILGLTVDIILAGIDVARRVMRIKLLISPGLVEVDTPLKEDWPITLNGNSITLTPGTITVDVKKTKSGSRFLVHCISQEAVKSIQENKGFVKRIQNIYRERK